MSERLWGILVDSFGKILLPGLTVTIPLTAISFTLALIIAVAVALVQFAHVPVLQRLARFYIWVIRGTPVLVQLFVVFYGLPGVGILIEPFPAAVLVFSINEGAYCAETIRAALESVPKGQMEAGQCVGMSYLQIIRRIILPQALRTAFPTLASTLIAMVKDTSLAANITVTEMFMTTQRIVARTYEPLALYIEVGLVYLLFCTVLTSALDPELPGELLAVKRSLAGEGRTMLVVTHEMDFARHAANRVVFMEQGVIVEQNTAEAFFNDPQQPRTKEFLQTYKQRSLL